jgi:hypothetical protein
VEPEKTPRERAEDLINLLVSDWRPSPRQVVWAIRIVLATAVVLGLLTLVGWPFGITLWDWLKLLVVPAALAIAGLLFTSSQQRAAQADAERRAQDQAVQDYLDRIGQLMIDKDMRNESGRPPTFGSWHAATRCRYSKDWTADTREASYSSFTARA